MQPIYCCKPPQKTKTLEELKEEVNQINRAIACILCCELCESVKDLTIEELKRTKASLKELMHDIIDTL